MSPAAESGAAAFDADAVKRVGLISDTHGKLRPGVFRRLRDVDVILHAGDIGSPEILVELQAIAPVHAVHGNTDDFDVRNVAPETVAVTLAGKRFLIAHGHMLGSPTPRSLRMAFPDCDVIIYGHTHRPLVDADRAPIVINPGAAGPARFDLKPTVAILDMATMQVELMLLEEYDGDAT